MIPSTSRWRHGKAGGPLKPDRFVDSANGGYVTDTALLDKLATEKPIDPGEYCQTAEDAP